MKLGLLCVEKNSFPRGTNPRKIDIYSYQKKKGIRMTPSPDRKAELRSEYLERSPSDRVALVERLSKEYGVSASTVRRWLGPLPRRSRTDAGESRAPISDSAFGNMLELYDSHPDMSVTQIIRYAENQKWIARKSISPDALKRKIDQFSPAPPNTPPNPTPKIDNSRLFSGWG